MTAKMMEKEFLTRAAETHGDRYDLSHVVFVSAGEKVTVVCREHGAFETVPGRFIKGRGCPRCKGASITAAKTKDKGWWETECRKVHGDKYDYSRVVYTKVRDTFEIVCQTHGSFMQVGWSHKAGQGCPKCAASSTAFALTYTPAEYATRANEVHNNKYTYISEYKSGRMKIEIGCPTHGSFWQEATSHLQGRGCPSCAKATLSQPEWDIIEIIKSHGYEARHGYRPAWMDGKELDVFVPALNLAIEYCGSWVHNTTKNPFGHQPKDKWYHYDKWKTCRDNGVTLLTIYDFEWMTNREKWEAVISHKLQKADHRVYARKCKIVPVEREVARAFCREHHVEGVGGMWLRTAECRGLEYQGELVAISVCEEGDIKRSCTKSGIAVIGGVSKLFKSFPAGTTMMTTNNTGSSGNYGTLVEKKTLRYWWVKLGTEPKAFPRRQCQKHMLEKRFGQPVGDKTERQYMEDLGYVKCYDSGLSYWVNA